VTTFKGNLLTPSDGSMFFEVSQGLWDSPDTRGEDTTVPTRPWRIHEVRLNDVLSIVLTGWVHGIGANDAARAASFDASMKLLRQWFRPDAAPGLLVVPLNDGTMASITARSRDAVPGPLISADFRRYGIRLEAYEDWLYT
jgi:hypothetical protein